MTPKTNLLDLLVNLPEVDTVDKRKAFVSFVGFASLGIYLDWEGASTVFFPRLVDELSRRGQPTMLQFLKNLPDAPQAAGVERKERAGKLAAEVRALDQAGWGEEFGVLPAAAPSRKPDLDMLALTAVSTVLVPYFKTVGAAGRPAAADLAKRIEQALTADPTAGVLWVSFKQNPEGLEAAMVPILKDKIGKDAGLVAELEKLTAVAVKEQTPRPGQIDVEQNIRLIQGKVVGAAIGAEIITGIYAKVKQVVDTVEAGGCLTGVKIGNI
jgi:hypothetical protein